MCMNLYFLYLPGKFEPKNAFFALIFILSDNSIAIFAFL